MKTVSRIAATALLLLLLLGYACSNFSASWYEGFLPETIEVEKTLIVDGSSGFTEGCGIAIYQIEKQTLERIRTLGLDAFKAAKHAKRHSDRLYDSWRETPYLDLYDSSLRNRWLGGMSQGCSDLPADMQRSIHMALTTPGSFYAIDAKARESGVIIVPRLGWAILSHFG